MPRPKGEPTRVVRLPVALLDAAEAEAKRTNRTLADVLAARLGAPVRATSGPTQSSPRARPRVTEAVAPRVQPRAIPEATGLNANGHLRFCKCPMCKPVQKGGK